MLIQQQIDQFNRDGYLVVEDLISSDLCVNAVVAEYADLNGCIIYAEWRSERSGP